MYSMPSRPPSPATNTGIDQISPTSTTRPGGRLRGLSYLRNYTQTHLLSRDHSNNSESRQRPSGLVRATSYPSPTSGSRRQSTASPSSPTALNLGFGTISGNSENPTCSSSTQDAASRLASDSPPATNTDSSTSTAPLSNNPTSHLDTARPMARTRSATVGESTAMPGTESQPWAETDAPPNGEGNRGTQNPSIRFSAHQDPRAQRPSLVFSPMSRILPNGRDIIKVGRYSEREVQPPAAPNVPSSAPVGFKSKVVSRRHCEFWQSGGRWYIKDVKSSSGTFLNHIRLSSPGNESRPFPVNDGDIVQLGIDFKGGEEMIFRCVKIRVELNKGWQQGPTSFNVSSHKRLRELNSSIKQAGSSSQDCSICLGPIAPCQSLFVAPCSHTWHYKCIRVIINGPHWPHFICPNCRTVADLEAELDDPSMNDGWEQLPEEANGTVQPPDSTLTATENSARQRQQNTSESTALPENLESTQVASPQPEHQRALSTASASDDSDMRDTSEEVRLTRFTASPSLSDESQPEQRLISSTPPVNIKARKPLNGTSLLGRGLRTPSPNGLPSSLNDHMPGVEGPMTPRNDVGPFIFDVIFDGTAGRVSSAGASGSPTPTNMDATTSTPRGTS